MSLVTSAYFGFVCLKISTLFLMIKTGPVALSKSQIRDYTHDHDHLFCLLGINLSSLALTILVPYLPTLVLFAITHLVAAPQSSIGAGSLCSGASLYSTLTTIASLILYEKQQTMIETKLDKVTILNILNDQLHQRVEKVMMNCFLISAT